MIKICMNAFKSGNLNTKTDVAALLFRWLIILNKILSFQYVIKQIGNILFVACSKKSSIGFRIIFLLCDCVSESFKLLWRFTKSSTNPSGYLLSYLLRRRTPLLCMARYIIIFYLTLTNERTDWLHILLGLRHVFFIALESLL